MNSIKKVLLAFMALLIVGTLILMLILSISSKKSTDKADFRDVDEHTIFVEETTPMNAEEETTEEFIYVPPTPSDAVARKSTVTDAAKSVTPVENDHRGNQTTEDKHAPVLLISRSNVVLKVGEPFDVHSYIGYGDDVDRNVDISMDSQVDTSKTGVNPVTILLKDDAGHETRYNMTVRVIESQDTGDTDDDTVVTPLNGESFADFQKKYKKAGTSLGIDVSRWQNEIDFQKVKAAGCEFVIMRIGGYDDGKHYTDSQYLANIKKAKEAGLKIGIYWHAEESTPEEVQASVKYMTDVLAGEKLDFPIAYDWEDFVHFEKYGMNLQDINSNFEVFADAVRKEGYEACLYSSKNFMQTVWTNDGNHKIWLAHYTSSTDYDGRYYMWQHTSSGKIDGINTPVDFNVLYE